MALIATGEKSPKPPITHERPVRGTRRRAVLEGRDREQRIAGQGPQGRWREWFEMPVVRYSGVPLTLAVLVALNVTSTTLHMATHPSAVLLAVVVYATAVGGLTQGLASAGLILLYHVVVPNTDFLRATEAGLVGVGVAAPITATVVAGLRWRLDAVTREREKLRRSHDAAVARYMTMRDANVRMGEFFGIASHELKGPLTNIRLNVQFAALKLAHLEKRRTTVAPSDDEAPGAADAHLVPDADITALRSLLANADQQVGRLARLVEDLLDASRARAGRLTVKPAPCDVGALVREVVEEHRLASPGRIIGLEMPDPPEIRLVADGERVRQVMTNYLTNAIKYSPAEGTILVRVQRRPRGVRVRVLDQGKGLTRQEAKRVWDSFERVAERPASGDDGPSGASLGLGLYICRAIVEQHGGRVGVRSTPGKGSTFWFTLPTKGDGSHSQTDATSSPEG